MTYTEEERAIYNAAANSYELVAFAVSFYKKKSA